MPIAFLVCKLIYIQTRSHEVSYTFVSSITRFTTFFNVSLEKKPVYNNTELFDPSLSKINSLNKLILFSDSSANNLQVKNGSLDYAILVASVIRKRFYHGFSNYTLQQNWIAAIAGYVFGRGLASPVNADEILQHPYAGCSQQAIVLMAVMKEKNISYRSVGFPHHYATEINFNNCWYYFDPNMEPQIKKNERNQNTWKGSADYLKIYYHRKYNYNYLNWSFGKSVPVIFGNKNANPAPHASIFQSITKYLSRLLWLFPFIIITSQKRTSNNLLK
jgi:hypothetical protein